ncbi:MAG TPA: DUF211 domain-containing protein [Meiothermus sp.]|nr:DUF211 domain-containing protein [Meiothermus sp.]
MNIRRVVLDVDKALTRPSLLELVEAIAWVKGVEGFNITVNEIDLETMGTEITLEGDEIDLIKTIEQIGCVVHSLDQLVVGQMVERALLRRGGER